MSDLPGATTIGRLDPRDVSRNQNFVCSLNADWPPLSLPLEPNSQTPSHTSLVCFDTWSRVAKEQTQYLCNSCTPLSRVECLVIRASAGCVDQSRMVNFDQIAPGRMFFVLLRFRKVGGTFALRVAVVTRMLLNLSAHCIQSPNRQVKSLPNLS